MRTTRGRFEQSVQPCFGDSMLTSIAQPPPTFFNFRKRKKLKLKTKFTTVLLEKICSKERALIYFWQVIFNWDTCQRILVEHNYSPRSVSCCKFRIQRKFTASSVLCSILTGLKNSSDAVWKWIGKVDKKMILQRYPDSLDGFHQLVLSCEVPHIAINAPRHDAPKVFNWVYVGGSCRPQQTLHWVCVEPCSCHVCAMNRRPVLLKHLSFQVLHVPKRQ